jgi:cytochrome bd-type quinol oxidase subunit 2
MNAVRRLFGFICMSAAIALAIFVAYSAVMRLESATVSQEDYVFWIVIVTIFIPIIIGFVLFGFYAFRGEYNEKPLIKLQQKSQ